MKITIYHNQNTIDPSATYSDDSFPVVMASLEAEYTRELLKAFPEAEVEFIHSLTSGRGNFDTFDVTTKIRTSTGR